MEKTMKFRVEDIPPQGKEAAFEEDGSTWLEERLKGQALFRIRFLAPVSIHLFLSRSGGVVLVRSRIQTRAEVPCARCLEPVQLDLNSEYKTSLKPKPPFPPPGEIEISREDLETEFYQGEEIDLTPLVQDQLLLALPAKTVCREECRGLCPRCGKNLNQGSCQCPPEGPDPRLEPLKNLKVH